MVEMVKGIFQAAHLSHMNHPSDVGAAEGTV